jgi:Family of unknown function (DUF6338)
VLSTDILKLINALLPGFLAAWVFYGLTAHPRKDMFERTVQALIFTALVNAVIYPIRELLFCLHRITGISAADWTEESSLVWSLLVAAIMGLLFAGLANNNSVHAWLGGRSKWIWRKQIENPKLKSWVWTKRTSFPAEWFSALNEDKRWVILHLNDEAERRIHGWPYEWPDHSDTGHFVLHHAEWITGENERIPLANVKTILIPAKNVEIVEIMLHEHEMPSATEGSIGEVDRSY